MAEPFVAARFRVLYVETRVPAAPKDLDLYIHVDTVINHFHIQISHVGFLWLRFLICEYLLAKEIKISEECQNHVVWI